MVLEDVLHAHPISEQRMKEVLGHTPLQARSQRSEPSSMHARMQAHTPAAPRGARCHTSECGHCLQRHTARCLHVAHEEPTRLFYRHAWKLVGSHDVCHQILMHCKHQHTRW